ncbi:MAG TPA: hypothetical protein VJA66_10800 [Thermoanaerobaculia bacterium]
MPNRLPMEPRNDRVLALAWTCVSLTALVVRVWLALTAPPSIDLQNYAETVRVLHTDAPFYESADHYNYSPVWSWVLRAADAASRSTGVGLTPVVRSILVAVDVGCAALLFLLSSGAGASIRWRSAGLYLANPVGIWVSAVQGQFDALALLFLLAAIASARRRASDGSALRPMAWLAFSLACKHVTLFHPVLFVRRRKDVRWLPVPYLFTALLFLPYASQWRAIRDRVLLYRSVPSSYGFSEFVLYESRLGTIVMALALLAGLAAALWLRGRDLERGSLILFLVLLFFAPGIGPQYFVWPLTLGALRPTLGYFALTGSAILWILGTHFGWPGSAQFLGHVVWLCVAFWAIREIKKTRDSKFKVHEGSEPPSRFES